MTFAELGRRVWYFLHRDQAARELEEEMRIHIQMRAESMLAQSTARDFTTKADSQPHAAAAQRQFGNFTATHQRSRDMWGFMNVEETGRDLRFAVRRLLQRPSFSLSVIGVTAIGIGCVTAMFSAVDAALLRPLPFARPEQLVVLPSIDVPFDMALAQGSRSRYLDITDVRDFTDTYSAVASCASGGLNLADAEQPVRLKAGVVTSNFFATLGIAPYRGRTFSDAEGKPGGADVVVLSYGLWQRQFGARDIANLRLSLGAKAFQVIGVMPERFSFPRESDVWIPLTVPTTISTFEAFRGFLPTTTVARLRPNVRRETAASQLLARFEQRRAQMNDGMRENYDEFLKNARANGTVKPLQTNLLGDRSSALYLLLGATALLLIIACVNVTNLLLSQASTRRREIAVRQVLGATRARLIRQLLTESVVLSVSGAVLGLLVAPLALGLMRQLLPVSLNGVAPAQIDWRVLLFATGLALGTGIVFGLWPAFRCTGNGENDVIKGGGGHGSTAANVGRARRWLVSVELALTVVLLIGAGLMLQSFGHVLRQDSGMRAAQVGTFEMTMSNTGGGRAARVQKVTDILARLSTMPGVISAGAVNDLPLNGIGGISVMVNIDGVSAPTHGQQSGARFLYATEGYFASMGISLLKGRLFTAADDSLAPKVVVISQSMAKENWPEIDPIGHTIDLGNGKATVIGVVSDVREFKLEQAGGPQMYMALRAAPTPTVAIVAKGSVGSSALLARMLDAVHGVDKSQAVYNVRMMEDVVGTAVAPRRTNTLLIGGFAMLALLLASVGVYAVVSYGVSHRARELGIRAALGASSANLVGMVSREMLSVTIAGVATGMSGAWMLARTLESLVYGVQVHDPFTFAIVPVALLLPVVVATAIPARRALTVNPAEVMRAD